MLLSAPGLWPGGKTLRATNQPVPVKKAGHCTVAQGPQLKKRNNPWVHHLGGVDLGVFSFGWAFGEAWSLFFLEGFEMRWPGLGVVS